MKPTLQPLALTILLLLIHFHLTATVAFVLPVLSTPEFTSFSDNPCGSTNRFNISNSNIGASTEIFRSNTEAGPFELYYTLGPGQTSYINSNVNPRTTYYYTLRASYNGEVSSFSDTLALTSGSDFFPPVLDGDYAEDGSIQFTFLDNSYADAYYEVYEAYRITDDSINFELLQQVIMSDSGSTVIIRDTTVEESGEFDYVVNAILSCDGNPTYSLIAGDTLYRFPPEPLYPPDFTFYGPPANEACGNEIAFTYYNYNQTPSSTEIYRATSADGEFELIHTEPGEGDHSYLDQNLGSRKTYYYKLRSVNDIEAPSEFSETYAFESGAAWFEPELDLKLLTDQTVEIKLTDRSYLDHSYEIYAVEEGTTEMTFTTGVMAPDSGLIYTFIDSSVVPGKTYIYYVNAQLVMACEGGGTRTDVAIDTIQIPITGPTVFNFTIVDPFTDQDVRTLLSGDTLDVNRNYNIRANASGETQSVQFFLNGKRFGENQEPYALFGDHKGNYNRGRLKPGFYTLTATAYSGNNQKGIKGNAMEITFYVTDNRANSVLGRLASTSDADVNIFPNPVSSYARIELSGMPQSETLINIVDRNGNSFKHFQQRLNDEGVLAKEITFNDLPRGTYFVIVKIDKQTYTKRIVVK